MKETGIILSGDHPKLILDGIKTMTRRVITPQPIFNGTDLSGKPYFIYKMKEYSLWSLSKICPYGQVGDRLWVRETFDFNPDNKWVFYRADSEIQPYGKWRPSIHMPRWASRITLEITEIRVERLQEISTKDKELMAEGIPLTCHPNNKTAWSQMAYEFSLLWDSLNAKRGYGWDTNCWVWVIGFRRMK